MPPKCVSQNGLTDTWGRRNRILTDQLCQRCGKLFRPRKQRDKYCSSQCGYANNGANGLSFEELFELIDAITLNERGCKILNRWNNRGGYPIFRIKHKRYRISRLVLERKLSRLIIDGLFALHTCDIPQCVNIDHIYEGSQKQNIADAKARNRLATGDRHGLRKHPERAFRGPRSEAHSINLATSIKRFYKENPGAILRGERNGCAKLCEDDIRAIRLAEGTLREIGARYGIGAVSVLRIQRRERWKHVI